MGDGPAPFLRRESMAAARGIGREDIVDKWGLSMLLIATPCYRGQLDFSYFMSMMLFKEYQIPFRFELVTNDAIITSARNRLISYFYNRRDRFDNLLFLDADVFLPPDGLVKMLSYKADVVGAVVPIRGFAKDNSIFPNIGSDPIPYEKDNRLAEVEWVGTAAVLLSKNAVISLVEDAIERGGVYSSVMEKVSKGRYTGDIPLPELSEEELKRYDVFSVGAVDGKYVSEDIGMCRKLRSLGYKILIDPSIPTWHSGMYTWKTPGSL